MGTENVDFLEEILIPCEEWQLIGEGYKFSEGTAVDRTGTVYFNDLQASIAYRLEGDTIIKWCDDTRRTLGQTFGLDGETLFATSWGYPELVRWDKSGHRSIFSAGTTGNDIVCHPSGDLYLTNPPPVGAENPDPSRIWLIRPNSERILVHEGIRFTNGIAISPDGKVLYVNDWLGVHVYRFHILEDGRLGEPDPFILLEKPADLDFAGSDGMRVDSKGRIWVTTRIGIQVFDTNGNRLAVLKAPPPVERYTHMVFGGPDFDTLYLTTRDAIYKRKLNVRGLNPWDQPK